MTRHDIQLLSALVLLPACSGGADDPNSESDPTQEMPVPTGGGSGFNGSGGSEPNGSGGSAPTGGIDGTGGVTAETGGEPQAGGSFGRGGTTAEGGSFEAAVTACVNTCEDYYFYCPSAPAPCNEMCNDWLEQQPRECDSLVQARFECLLDRPTLMCDGDNWSLGSEELCQDQAVIDCTGG